MTFNLTLVTPEKKMITNQPAKEVVVPAFKGELNILPGHAPLLTTLEPGILKYKLDNEDVYTSVAISWGYCQVSSEGVNILAENAEMPSEIDLQTAQAHLKSLTEKLAHESLNDHDWVQTQLGVKKAQAEIDIISAKH